MYHISDGNLNSGVDQHLRLGEGEYDFEWIKKLFKSTLLTSFCTFEIPRQKNNFEDDISGLNFFQTL